MIQACRKVELVLVNDKLQKGKLCKKLIFLKEIKKWEFFSFTLRVFFVQSATAMFRAILNASWLWVQTVLNSLLGL